MLDVREPVVDDLPAGHQRQPRVADDERRAEHRQEHDPDERDEEDRKRARLEDRAKARCECGSPSEVGNGLRREVCGRGFGHRTMIAVGAEGQSGHRTRVEYDR